MKRRSKGRKLLIALLILLAVLFCLLIGAYAMFHEQLAAASSVQQLDDGIYTLEYAGDYGFDDFLAQGGAASDEEVGAYLTEFLSHGFYSVEPATGKQGCSTVQAPAADGSYLFGRNFDWQDCAIMVVQTEPADGYAAIATCNLNFLGFGDDYLPEGFMNKMMALAAIYVPQDGMNEQGLCVADLMIDVAEDTRQDTDKIDLTTSTAIRLLLDHAATVDEAVELLRQYDMNSSAGMMHHLAIADRNGNSVVAEYIDNELVITETPVVTNFFLSPGEKYGIGSDQSKTRYAMLNAELDAHAIRDGEQMKSALRSVSKGALHDETEMTVWSIVYDRAHGDVTYYFRENYEAGISFELPLSDVETAASE